MELTVETVNKVCPYCEKTMAVDKRYAAAVVSHIDCVMEAVRPVREELQAKLQRNMKPA